MGQPETEYEQRMSPRLRMIVNGDAEVNANRSELSGCVKSDTRQAERARQVLDAAAAAQEVPQELDDLDPPESRARATPRATVSCFVHLTPGASLADLDQERSGPPVERGSLAVAELTPAQIQKLSRGRRNAYESGIAYVETGTALSPPTPLSSFRSPQAPTPPPWRDELPEATSPVIIGLIDVGGFDFAHPDFLDADGKTRFLAIWDQGDPRSTTTRAEGDLPAVHYGRLIAAEAMNEAITDAEAVNVAASDFVIQSTQIPGSHATHVASIAGGNHGVCPDALLVGVSIALGSDDLERRTTFYDSTRLADAVDFIFELASNLGYPAAVNISLGTNGHAHDGTSPIARWIDSALAEAGRCVCVAAGNSGQEAPQFEGDIGHVSGRIHAAGKIAARGLVSDLEWRVIGNGRLDVSENELEVWYRPGDELSVQVRSPDGFESEWVSPGEYYENFPLPGGTFLSVYNERYHPANGANRISVFLSPRLKQPIVGVTAGTWVIRLRGDEVRDGCYDAWIERDDARPVGRIGDNEAWRFPSYFSARSNVDRSSVSSLACGRDVISVANADMAAERIHVSSSQGPTWDGRPKPDIAGPGTDVVAARGFGGTAERDRWMAKTGTSMASPQVCGVAAQMLAREPRLTATQIVGIMRRTAQPLPGADYQWQDDAGFGVIEPERCVARIGQPFTSHDKKAAQDGEGGA